MNVPAAHPAQSTRSSSSPGADRRHADFDDIELIRLFNNGDALAFVEIATRYRDRLCAVAFGMLKNHADAEEIAQDALMRAHRGLATFRGDSSLATWLHRIALNLARNRYWYFFRRQRHNSISLDCSLTEHSETTLANHVASEAAGPAREAVTREFSELILECMDRLDTPARTLLTLRNSLNLSYEEIAREMNLNIGTVKSRLARARARLRALLVESCPDLQSDAEPVAWFDPIRPATGVAVICA